MLFFESKQDAVQAAAALEVPFEGDRNYFVVQRLDPLTLSSLRVDCCFSGQSCPLEFRFNQVTTHFTYQDVVDLMRFDK